jgi:hypothetical protein
VIVVGRYGDDGGGAGVPSGGPFTGALVGGGNGGAASTATPGGNGGRISVALAPGGGGARQFRVGNEVPHESTDLARGGRGFDACTPPGTGTRGGAGGTLTVEADAEVTTFWVEGSLLVGGDGGDGFPPGARGEGGSGSVQGQPLVGAPGQDGGKCPLGVTLDETHFSFSHEVGTPPCPQHLDIGSFTLENVGEKVVTFRIVSVVNADALEATVLQGTLQPGERRTIQLRYKCNKPDSFTALFDIELSATDEPTQTVRMTVDGHISHRVVRLAHAIGTFEPGEEIRLDRIEGGHVGGPEAGCSEDHLHASPPGITIDGEGPFPDPDPTGCGYGVIVATEGGG